MEPVQAVLALYATQQVVFAIVWLTLAKLRMSRRATALWGIASLLMGAGAAILLASAWLTPRLSSVLAALVHLTVCLMILRGLRRFMRMPPAERGPMTLVLAAAAAVVGMDAAGLSQARVLAPAEIAIGLLLLFTARDVRRGLWGEFGRAAAMVCAAPLLTFGVLMLARGMLPVVGLERAWQPLDGPGTAALVVAVVLTLLAMLTNFTLGATLLLRLVKRLRHLSQHDTLTHLLNRRAFMQRLGAERARQRRDPAPLALLALDLDHFKAVNDRFGHAGGDAVLAATAGVLAREARSVDAVARMGGEEFALLLPGTDLDGANRMAERLLEAMRREVVDADGHPVTVTASIGVAVADDAHADQADLFRQADRALYLAKAGGRDRVVCAGALSAVPSPAPHGPQQRRAA